MCYCRERTKCSLPVIRAEGFFRGLGDEFMRGWKSEFSQSEVEEEGSPFEEVSSGRVNLPRVKSSISIFPEEC